MSERFLRHILGSLAASLVVSLVLVAAPPRAAEAGTGFRRLGVLPVGPGSALVSDGATRRIIEIGGGTRTRTAEPGAGILQPDTDGVLFLNVFDSRSFKRVRHADLAPYWPQNGSGGRPRVFAFDERARHLLVLAYSSEQEMINFANPQLVTIDADSLRAVSTTPLITAVPQGMRVLGMRSTPNGKVMLVVQAIPVANVPLLFPLEAPRLAGAYLVEVDPSSGAAVWGPAALRGCQAIITNQSQSAIGISGETIFVGCATTQLLGVPAPGLQAVASVDRADPSSQHLYYLPGSYASGDAYFDELGQRMLLVGSTVGSPAQAVWVFDMKHRVFVGQVASGDVNVLGAGLNSTSGRLYVGVDDAVLVTTGRGLQIPQAVRFDVPTNIGAITALPFANAIVVPTRGPGSSWIFVVYGDTLPGDTFVPGREPRYSELDALTADAPQFGAESQAYGLRVHTIGAVNAALQNTFPLQGNYWRDPGNLTGLKDGDRDVLFSRLTRVHLSADEASAGAIAADRDANTKSDYDTIDKSVDLPEWPYEPAGCRDFGSGAGKAQDPVEGAETSCSLASGSVSARAEYEGVGLPGTITVAESSSGATLRLDRKLGLVNETYAEARNVVIGDTVRIALVRSESYASAVARKGGAKGTYTRIFRGVRAGDLSCNDECDPSEVLAAITEELGSSVRVEFPAEHVVATPGGSHSHAFRDPWQHQQDVVINNQDETQLQVPALRLTFVNDKSLASRVIVELAGTMADATSLRVVPTREPETPPAVVLPRQILPPVAPPVPQPPAVRPPAPRIIEKVVRTLGHGWKVLVTGRPVMIVRSVALWGLFMTPLFLAVRRRVLRRLEGAAP